MKKFTSPTPFRRAATVAGLTALALSGTASAEVFFGWNNVPGAAPMEAYANFGKQGRFLATSDYGFTPGGEDQLTAAKLGLVWEKKTPYVRGQNPVSVSDLGEAFYGTPWLSDGGDAIFGLAFEKPFKPLWEREPEKQFADSPDQIPRFDKAVIYWGRLTPKPGTWGASILDNEGNLKRVAVDNQQALYPYDQTTIHFPATNVKKLYFGVKGGEKGAKDNFVEVRGISLLMNNAPRVTNRLVIEQPDAYRANYSLTTPGEITSLLVRNFYFNGSLRDEAFLNNLSPFIEVGGQRFRATKSDGVVETAEDGRTETLRYPLTFTLPDGKEVKVDVTATFSVELKDSLKFALKATGLPAGAQLGFEMTGDLKLFANFTNLAAPIKLIGATQSLPTPAGPFGIALTGADKLTVTRVGEDARFDTRTTAATLEVALSLPMGPEGGIQPGMINYQVRPSLATQGESGIAPFNWSDLELLETINVGDPNDPYTVYDISNDPLVLNWKKTGEAKLPSKYGNLAFINDVEKAKVPITTVLGQPVRDLGPNESTYFRVNLKTRFESQVPYLIVVEHAFDKERRGEFHTIPIKPDGTDWTQDDSLWGNPAPFGGFDTGKGPYPGGFKTESIFTFRAHERDSGPSTMLSFVFSNNRLSSYYKNFDQNPDGLAIKNIRIYRVARLPELPDLTPLIPKSPRREVTMSAENFSPWMLSEFPKVYGYDSVWTHRQPAAQFLYAGSYIDPLPAWRTWTHAASLQGNAWLYEKAARDGVKVKTTLGWLLDLGYEGTDHHSFLGFGWLPGPIWGSIPLSPTPAELKHLSTALDRSLGALAKFPSLSDIAVGDLPAFSQRDLNDFSKATGIAFESSPAPEENLKRLLESPPATIQAWSTWASQKRFEFLSWLLTKVRTFRPDIRLTINQSWYLNGLQAMYYGNQWPLDTSRFAEKGINDFATFLKFTGIDPALYSKSDGFVFALEMEPAYLMPGKDKDTPGRGYWPFDGVGEQLRNSFGGGLSVSSCGWDESKKPLQAWGCNYLKDQRSFRKGLIDALLQANAREYVFQSYYYDSVRGRLFDLRELAVPFRLLPFAKPEPFTGKISDSTKKAVIQKYGDRYGLVNPGDQATDVTLTLPDGASGIADLSNGIRQELAVSSDRTVTLRLTPWSLKTLEIK